MFHSLVFFLGPNLSCVLSPGMCLYYFNLLLIFHRNMFTVDGSHSTTLVGANIHFFQTMFIRAGDGIASAFLLYKTDCSPLLLCCNIDDQI